MKKRFQAGIGGSLENISFTITENKPWGRLRSCGPSSSIGVALENSPYRKLESRRAMEKNPYTILVAEDEPNSRLLYQETLTEAGYRVLSAKNGLEVLAELRDEAVDLLITDLKMPDMSALDMLPQVRKDHPRLPIIVVSAYYRDLQEDFNSKGNEVQAFFNKPVGMAQILRKVAELLGENPNS